MTLESVFLTGGTGLLGKSFIEALLMRKLKVIFTSTSSEKIAEIIKDFGYDSNLFGCQVDLMSENFIQIIDDFLNQIAVQPDYLINNARSLKYLDVGDYKTISKQKWLAEYELNVFVPYRLATYLAFRAHSQLKSVVNISSIYSLAAYNHYLCNDSTNIPINYGVSKSAMNQLTRELAVRFLQDGKDIRVNSIIYGGVAGRADSKFLNKYAKLCPSKKMLEKEDITGHVLYLCSELSKGMTGHNMVVDGGFLAW